jgi:DNA primase catalytic core, N-terminal domain/Toprim-like
VIALADEPKVEGNDWSRVGPHRASTSPPSGAKSDWHTHTSDEMTAAGVATVARTGRLIDRFRDRVMLPIIHNREILGFIGRRHPDLGDAGRGGPKYLNTADTPLFHKGAQLFGANEVDIAAGGIPVIVEGPMDAIAITLAGGGRYIGVAPLGTSLTNEQASQLARLGKTPIVATDADIAGTPPNATSGSSPLTASTPDLPCSLRTATRPIYWPSTALRRSRPCWTRRNRSVNGLSRIGSPTCHPNRPSTRRRGSSPPAPRNVGTRPVISSAPASTFPYLRSGRPCSPT